jgi:hypothetical protein
MIPVIIWLEKDNVQLYETYLDCDDVDIQEVRLNYRTSRSIKGRKRQDWNGSYHTFNLSISNLEKDKYETLMSALRSQEGELVLLYDNCFYNVANENPTLGYKPKWSSVKQAYVYNMSLSFEENIEESEEESSYDFSSLSVSFETFTSEWPWSSIGIGFNYLNIPLERINIISDFYKDDGAGGPIEIYKTVSSVGVGIESIEFFPSMIYDYYYSESAYPLYHTPTFGDPVPILTDITSSNFIYFPAGLNLANNDFGFIKIVFRIEDSEDSTNFKEEEIYID